MTSAPTNDAARLRVRADLLRDDLSRLGPTPAFGSPSLVAQTTAIQAYPIVARSFFGCTPLTVLGPEIEGGAGVLTPGSATFLALNVGTAVPPIGTTILATFVESRWVFRYDG